MSEDPQYLITYYDELGDTPSDIEAILVQRPEGQRPDFDPCSIVAGHIKVLSQNSGVHVPHIRVWKMLPIRVKEATTIDIDGLDSMSEQP